MNAACLLTNEAWLKEHLGAPETLASYSDYVAIGKLISFLLVRAFRCFFHLSVEVERDVAQLFLNIAHDLALGSCGERVTTLSEDFHQIFGEVTSSQIEPQDGMWKCVAFIDWHCMRDTITTVHHNTCGTTTCIKRKNCLNGHIHGWGVECLKHDLSHPLAVGLWVQRCLCKKHWVLFWCHTQLIVESVVPNLFHVVPIGHDSMLDRILQSQNTSLALCLVANIAVFLVHSHHDSWHLWTAYDGREDRTGRI